MGASRVLPFVLLAAALGITPSAHATGGGDGGDGGPSVKVVAKDLDSPRHLAFGARGDLFVTEAGRGGPVAPCFVGGEGPACWGTTGAVTKVDRWGRHRASSTGCPRCRTRPASTARSARTASPCWARTR